MFPKQIPLTVLLLVEVSEKLAMEYIKNKDEKLLEKKKTRTLTRPKLMMYHP